MVEKSMFVPVSRPTVTTEDKEAVSACLDKTYLSGDSPIVKEFEQIFSGVIGREHGITVSNGSAALDVVMHALDLHAGDEVIVPSFTIASCLFAILRTGATPVFVDCDSQTWNMSLETIETKVTTKTRAIMVVHIYGLPVDMDPIINFCEKRSITIIEDAAEAHGVRYKDKLCGSFGLASTFSFYANKAITTGEGGMVVSDDLEFSDRIRSYRNLSFLPPPGKRFVHEELGWNMRMSSIQAALGISQTNRLEAIVNRKREIGLSYRARLSNQERITMQIPETSYSKNMYWVFGILLDSSIDIDQITLRLKSVGVETRPFFYPLHSQPLLRKYGLEIQEKLPISEDIGARGLYLPSFLEITETELDYVVENLNTAINNDF
jgi:perosamine synthetase